MKFKCTNAFIQPILMIVLTNHFPLMRFLVFPLFDCDIFVLMWFLGSYIISEKHHLEVFCVKVGPSPLFKDRSLYSSFIYVFFIVFLCF